MSIACAANVVTRYLQGLLIQQWDTLGLLAASSNALQPIHSEFQSDEQHNAASYIWNQSILSCTRVTDIERKKDSSDETKKFGLRAKAADRVFQKSLNTQRLVLETYEVLR